MAPCANFLLSERWSLWLWLHNDSNIWTEKKALNILPLTRFAELMHLLLSYTNELLLSINESCGSSCVISIPFGANFHPCKRHNVDFAQHGTMNFFGYILQLF